MSLDGQRALVTGGGTGVGAEIARTLAGAGAEVWIAGRRAGPLEEVAAETDGIRPLTGDVTDPASCAAMIAEARPQLVIANAGNSVSKPFHRMDAGDLQDMLAVNLFGVFNVFSAALGPMRAAGTGRLISIASTAGLKGYAYVSGYAAAKHAVIGLTRSLALELAGTGITVNAVCPGFTETPMLEDSLRNIMDKTGRSREEAKKALTATNPQDRFVQPCEVADAVLWLAGVNAGAVTGQAISVSGGEVM
ncbi:SDR family NAD(P)-dependent oxidoreductase [Sulfitobacter sp. D35]|uniref:SDR family NAD(P)-dependent oxidoreductase n=1 Tax=Sulfitobacter sp. D35 TaxID=3083252 RepID=UPI00296F58D0|nr:SDR family NAD(P)-dependent oxidoreductase [Sulfitobacter sp. D35]MDW4498888.1 SDR family NAD(P)-dependent oxidoreductase [Sulfitobacter sp. D35]